MYGTGRRFHFIWNAVTGRALAFVILLCTASCSSTRVKPPSLVGNKLSPTQRQELFNLLDERARQVRTFRSIARASLEYGRERGRLRYAFVFSYPQELRVEALPINGLYTLNLLVSQENQTVFLDPAEKQAFISHSAQDLLQKSFRLNVSKQELMSLLLGRIDADTLKSEGIDVVVDAGGYYVVANNDGSWFWRVDPQTLCTNRVESWQGKQQRLIVVYGPCSEQNGYRVPQSMVLLLPQDDVIVTFQQQHISINQDLPEGLFKAAIPGDYRIEWVR